jgi:quercetin dioxygenase-like cupin family protein
VDLLSVGDRRSLHARSKTAAAEAAAEQQSILHPVHPYRLFRWDDIALEKVTEMVSRKFVSGERETIAQVYLKRGAIVPQHAHDSEQMTYVLQGALQLIVAGEPVTLREGEVLHIRSGVAHQVEALDDTFVLGVFSPVRQDWLA